MKDARAVLFTCDEERILARQSFKPYRCREEVVYYGTALPAGNAEKQMNIFLKKYPQLKGKRILLYLGRIHEKKGIDILIQAFAQLKSDNDIPVANDIHLVIAGPCADQNYLQSLKNQALNFEPKIADHIIWTGMLKDDLKWGAYHSADAFILPSHQENFGIAVVEAYLSKLKKITDQRCPTEWLGPIFDSEKLQHYYEQASFLVYPSIAAKGEASPLTPVEAMAKGCIPILSNLDCFNDYLQPGYNGFSFDLQNGDPVDNLVAVFKKATEIFDSLEDMKKACLDTARNFLPGIIAEQYLSDFKTLLKS